MKTVLEEAQDAIYGPRNEAYGHPAEDFTRVGRMWGAILGLPKAVPPEVVGLCMAAIKIAREVHSHSRDNLTDLAGYAGCVARVHERQQEVEQDWKHVAYGLRPDGTLGVIAEGEK